MSPAMRTPAGWTSASRNFRARICMKIKDNGRSFQVERVLRRQDGTNDWDCSACANGWRWSAAALRVESAPGKGTTIRAEIPHLTQRR